MSASTISSVVEQAVAVEAQLGGVQAGLVAVEQDELARAEAGDLAAQLGADRAAGAGDQDALAGDLLGDGGHVELDRAAAEQVGDVDVAQVARGGSAADDLADGGRIRTSRPASAASR